jgi:hypothetical protein
VIQLEQTNNTLIEQIQMLTESKNRLLEMVEVAKNGLHHNLPRALTSVPIPHRVAPPPPPPALNLDAIFLLNHIQGASTLSPVVFEDTYLLAILGALSSERNTTSQQAPPEQTSGDSSSTGSMQQHQYQQQLAAQRHHQQANAAACDRLGSAGPKI